MLALKKNGLITYTDGTKAWYVDDYFHREDGPAIEYSDGNKSWYFHGKHIDCETQEEFTRICKLKAFW